MKWEYQNTNYKRENNPNYRGGKEVPCAQCGIMIYRRPSELKKRKNHFCSAECHDEFRRKPKDPNRLRRKDMKGKRHPRWSGPKYCRVCKKELLERKERRNGVCSKECSIKSKEKGAIKSKVTMYGPDAGRGTYICEYCGKEIETTKSVAERRRFCSNACHIASGTNLKFNGPSKLELAVAEALIELELDYISQHKPHDAPGLYDFYIPSLNLLIEADGEFWHHSEWIKEHTDVEKRDKEKNRWAKRNGYSLIRLREKDILKKGAIVLLQKYLGK